MFGPNIISLMLLLLCSCKPTCWTNETFLFCSAALSTISIFCHHLLYVAVVDAKRKGMNSELPAPSIPRSSPQLSLWQGHDKRYVIIRWQCTCKFRMEFIILYTIDSVFFNVTILWWNACYCLLVLTCFTYPCFFLTIIILQALQNVCIVELISSVLCLFS